MESETAAQRHFRQRQLDIVFTVWASYTAAMRLPAMTAMPGLSVTGTNDALQARLPLPAPACPRLPAPILAFPCRLIPPVCAAYRPACLRLRSLRPPAAAGPCV